MRVATIPNAPPRDWEALVEQYHGHTVEPLRSSVLYRDEQQGTKTTFWVIDLAALKMVEVPATLQIVGERALWYTADALAIDDADLARVAREFDNRIFPSVKRTFAPNADVPGRITILNADIPGLGGYFSSADAVSAAGYRFSNERMMMVMNGTGAVGSRSYQGTLAHELQHLVYSRVDDTEDTWVSEGTAELAATSLGLPALPYQSFFSNHAVSLANWPEQPGQSIPAYAGASLFASYLVSRTHLDNIWRLVDEPSDGDAGVEAYLGSTIGETFGAFFGDWLVANLVGANNGRYAYLDGVPGRVTVRRSIDGPGSLSLDNVPQLSGAYVNVGPGRDPFRVTFDGAETARVLPVDARSGEACWWSNRGDSIGSTLTREVDLSGITSATLTFWGWYDIEEAFDYGYVSISTDDGRSWHPLEGTHTSDDNPLGASLGPGYTGKSGGWVQERVDLGPYAGDPVLVRFQYITDESVNNAGWCIDDIAIQAIGFTDDAESDGGWSADGFFRVPNTGIPQTFVLRTVKGSGDGAVVTDHPLDAANDATFVVDGPTTVVIGPLTARTSQPAGFTLTVESP